MRARWVALAFPAPVIALVFLMAGHPVWAVLVFASWAVAVSAAVRRFVHVYGPSRARARRVARLLWTWESACEGAGCVTQHTRQAPLVALHRPITGGVQLTLVGAVGFNASAKVQANLATSFGARSVRFPVTATGTTVVEVVWVQAPIGPRASPVLGDG